VPDRAAETSPVQGMIRDVNVIADLKIIVDDEVVIEKRLVTAIAYNVKRGYPGPAEVRADRVGVAELRNAHRRLDQRARRNVAWPFNERRVPRDLGDADGFAPIEVDHVDVEGRRAARRGQHLHVDVGPGSRQCGGPAAESSHERVADLADRTEC